MSALFATLPAPRHNAPTITDDNDSDSESTSKPAPSTSTALVAPTVIPPYGQRKNFRPKTQADFGDGGSYPECHIAQFPLDLGRKSKTTAGNTLALKVDSEGKVSFDAIATQGHRDGVHVQSQFKDLVPLAHRTDLAPSEQLMERPSEEDVLATAARTKAALEKLVTGKIKTAQPKHVEKTGGGSSFIRYTPAEGDGNKQRIIKMTEVVEDPLEPPKFKGKKIPRGPPSPPPPVLRSPPRKVTAQEQKDWMIPPCVSNWKNNKGYTIPLDKRLAADGRGLQDVLINDRFAQFSEALYVADRHARDEVRQRSLMQQRIAEKEKEAKEEGLRALAQRAREERAGIAQPTVRTAGTGGTMALGAYGSDSDSDGSVSDDEEGGGAARVGEEEEEEDEKGAAEREAIRRERKKEREREMRMSNMGTEQRAKILARATGRDISEKIALGLAKPTLSKDAMLDTRLFNQEQLSGSFGDADGYQLYDKPLFSGSSAAAAIYKPRGANIDDDGNEIGDEEAVGKSLQNNRYGMGVAGRGFEGADTTEVRDGPVAFEKDTADPFGVDAFLETAKAGTAKRGLDVQDSSSKRSRQ